MTKNKLEKCTYEEYAEFIDKYPRPLEIDVAGMFEPPLKTHNDFSLGDWPDSAVAACKVPYEGEKYDFMIMEEETKND